MLLVKLTLQDASQCVDAAVVGSGIRRGELNDDGERRDIDDHDGEGSAFRPLLDGTACGADAEEFVSVECERVHMFSFSSFS